MVVVRFQTHFQQFHTNFPRFDSAQTWVFFCNWVPLIVCASGIVISTAFREL